MKHIYLEILSRPIKTPVQRRLLKAYLRRVMYHKYNGKEEKTVVRVEVIV